MFFIIKIGFSILELAVIRSGIGAHISNLGKYPKDTITGPFRGINAGDSKHHKKDNPNDYQS